MSLLGDFAVCGEALGAGERERALLRGRCCWCVRGSVATCGRHPEGERER